MEIPPVYYKSLIWWDDAEDTIYKNSYLFEAKQERNSVKMKTGN